LGQFDSPYNQNFKKKGFLGYPWKGFLGFAAQAPRSFDGLKSVLSYSGGTIFLRKMLSDLPYYEISSTKLRILYGKLGENQYFIQFCSTNFNV
jgi:hypothetical protein